MIWYRGDEIGTQDLYELLCLRVQVFVVEQTCAYLETDGRDLLPATHHAVIRDDQGIAASVRLLTNESPARVGRVVTRQDARGRGLSAQLVSAAHELAGAHGTVLDAQTHLVGWYEKLGYKASGPGYIDEDGIPHTPMQQLGSLAVGPS